MFEKKRCRTTIPHHVGAMHIVQETVVHGPTRCYKTHEKPHCNHNERVQSPLECRPSKIFQNAPQTQKHALDRFICSGTNISPHFKCTGTKLDILSNKHCGKAETRE